MHKFTKWFTIVLIACIACTIVSFTTQNHVNDTHQIPRMKGVCWVAGDSIAAYNFNPLHQVHGNWISQTPFGWMDGHDNPIVNLNTHRAWWGETDRGIIHTTQLAKEAGINVMLKPHIWIMNSNGKWRHDIAMNSREEWDQWFDNYEIFILHYAKLCEENDIDALCIGTELYKTTTTYPDRWRDIISKIRNVYSGELTYGANWYLEYEEIEFWDALDYIGIQSYFPLTKKENPSVEILNKGWKKHKTKLEKISKKYGKKIVFTEVGFKNTSDAAIEPWTWPQNLDRSKTARSDQTQINCYHAMFESLWNEPWVDGFFIWKWFHTTYKYKNPQEHRKAVDQRRAKRDNKYHNVQIFFSPQRTGALDVLSSWYEKCEIP